MRIAIASVLLMLAGCGNWYEDDLVFLYAVPQKDDLKSKLTGTGNTTSQPLVSVGSPSETYDKTKKGSDDFNLFIDGVLAGLDAIRAINPTRREENARFWGPYPDKDHPGFDGQVEIHRSQIDGTYTWSYKMRPRGGMFVTVAGGDFKPTVTLRKGQGKFFFDGIAARALLGVEKKPDDGDRVDIGYATDTNPVVVELQFIKDSTTNLVYAFNGYEDKSALLTYVGTDAMNPDVKKASFVVTWDAKTAGRADFLILEGKYAGGHGTECWDDAHLVVYAQGYDDAGMEVSVGDAGTCVVPKDLKPLP